MAAQCYGILGEGQRYFRQAVLNAYNGRCAVTGLAVRELLIASHIVPWNAAEQHRLDPRNDRPQRPPRPRLRPRPCLPAGRLITFDTDLRLVCASSLRDHFVDATVALHFKRYEGYPLTVPTDAAGPKPEHLAWHRENLFVK
jgi:predicted restriction endonuclease